MNCPNCNTQIADNATFCTCCGLQFVVENQNSQYQQVQSNTPCDAKQSATFASAPQIYAPALKLPTNRSLVKMIFLSLITFGIYGVVIWNKIAGEINITASRYDGKRTCPYFATLCLSMITYGIFAFVWQHKFTARVGDEIKRRGYNYDFGAADFWLWCVLGSLIIVGPFIYCHKLMKSMNMINASYNIYG